MPLGKDQMPVWESVASVAKQQGAEGVCLASHVQHATGFLPNKQQECHLGTQTCRSLAFPATTQVLDSGPQFLTMKTNLCPSVGWWS